MTPYAQRLIDIVITAGPATSTYTPPKLGPGKGNTLTLTGHRVSVAVVNAGMVSMATLSASIFGMTLSDMNALTTLANPVYFSNNVGVQVLAGNVTDGMATAFEGYMTWAAPNFTGMPDVSFDIQATTGLPWAMASAPARSFQGRVSIGTICAAIAKDMGLTLENNGCTTVLTNPYLPGTLLDQLQSATQAAGVQYIVEGKTLAIWPNSSYRTSQTDAPTISAQTGLVGYPTYRNLGVAFRTLYNPALKYGAPIQLKSSLTPATGKWWIYNMSHTLDSLVPHGNWFTDALATTQQLWPLVTSGAIE